MNVWQNIFQWLRSKPTALAITSPVVPMPLPPPVDTAPGKDEAAWAKYILAGGILAEADTIRRERQSVRAAAMTGDVPPAVQDIIARGVTTVRAQEAAHTLWSYGALPLPTNPFMPDDAWHCEITRRLNAVYQHADMLTLARIESQARAGVLRLEIAVDAPRNTFAWQRFTMSDNRDQRQALARTIVTILLGVLDVKSAYVNYGIQIDMVAGMGGWGFDLYDDGKAEVA